MAAEDRPAALDNDLDVLDPPRVEVKYRGERLEIQPLVLHQIPEFTRLINPLVVEFAANQDPAWLASDEAMVVDLLERHGEAIIKAAAIATGRPVDFIAGGTSIRELFELATAIVRVNHDFFWRAVAAQVHRVIGQGAEGAPDGGGQISSST